jgi:hypothetical protein
VKAEAAAAKAEQVKQKEAAKVELAKAKAEAKAATDKVKAAAAKVKAPKAVAEEPKAAPKSDAPYEPIPDELLTRKGLSDDQVAEREVADYAPNLREKYAKNVKFRRSTLRDRLETIAGDEKLTSDADSASIGKLYHQMDESHNQAEVRRHLAHWTSKMDPVTKKAIHDAVAPLLKLWKE